MKIDHRIEIAANAETVWHFLTDPEQLKIWIPELVSDEPEEPGVTRVGLKSRMKLREGKKIVEYGTVLTGVAENSLLEMQMNGGSLGASPMTVGYRLTPGEGSASSGNTTLDYTSAWHPREFMMRLMSPLISIMAKRNVRSQLGRLKALAEGSR